jgi:hypothetical protein
MRTGDRALAKKMAYIKKLYEGVRVGDVMIPEKGGLGGHSPAVLEAAKYFGLELSDRNHRMLLLYILSDLLFGKSKPGRPSKRKWDDRKILRLGTLYDQIRRADPDLSDSKIAKLIYADHKKEFQSCENVRQNLAEAKEAFCDSLRREHPSYGWPKRRGAPIEPGGSIWLTSEPDPDRSGFWRSLGHPRTGRRRR